MANFAPDRPGIPGGAATMRNAAAADSLDNNGATIIVVNNTSGGPITLTIDDPNSQLTGAQTFNPDVQKSCAVGITFLGPYPPSRFNDVNSRLQFVWGSTPGATLQWGAVSAQN